MQAQRTQIGLNPNSKSSNPEQEEMMIASTRNRRVQSTKHPIETSPLQNYHISSTNDLCIKIL